MKTLQILFLVTLSLLINPVEANTYYGSSSFKLIFIQDNPMNLLREKGCKVYITGNDSNAQIHFKREIQFYDVWEIKLNKSEADFEVKLLTNKTGIANADREVRVVMTDIKSGQEVYSSPIVRGTDYGFRTVNLKEAAIKNLVENEIRTNFFN